MSKTPRFRYFTDTAEGTTEHTNVYLMDVAKFRKLFPGVKGIGSTGERWAAIPEGVSFKDAEKHQPITRKIEYKSNPSLHECNAKCLGGKCNGTCECRCGGKNHGRGSLTIAG